MEAALTENETQRVLINKFVVPDPARDEFMRRLRINRAFIETLPGFVQDFVFEQSGGPGQYNVVTVAVWDSVEAIETARQAVYAEYGRTGYDPEEMYERLGIEADIAHYTPIEA